MENVIMTLRDVLEYSVSTDFDICDDYDESCFIAICGKTKVTEYCERIYEDILDLKCECTIDDNGYICDATLIICGTGNDQEWCEYKVRKAARFLGYAAGYCSEEKFNKLFESVMED